MDSTPTSTATHGLSVNIYGRGDASLGDTPSHMGITLHELGSSTCNMYHIRNPNDTDFIYDPRTQPFDDPVLRGRCELTTFTSEAKDQAASLLSAYGEDKSHIPVFGEGNCQDWVAGATLMLERAGLLKPGEGNISRGESPPERPFYISSPLFSQTQRKE